MSGRDADRITAVMDAIESIWCQHPELRLGQLLMGLNDGKDIFFIEEDRLLALIEEKKKAWDKKKQP